MVSPLTEAIHMAEKCGNVEYVLKQASSRFEQNGYIYQTLAISSTLKRGNLTLHYTVPKEPNKEHNTIHTYQIL